MGLNWAEGLKETSKGLDKLGAAMEKTDELEYRNIRDKNLRRFQLEDQAHESAEAVKEREFKTSERKAGVTSGDEAKGIGESDRAVDYDTKITKDLEKKQEMAIARIQEQNKGRIKAGKQPLTKAQYIDRGMQEMKTLWDAASDITSAKKGNRMMPAFDADMFRARFANDYEKWLKSAGVSAPSAAAATGTSTGTPFDPEDDPEAEAPNADPYDIFAEEDI
jgi:hypothetical protein